MPSAPKNKTPPVVGPTWPGGDRRATSDSSRPCQERAEPPKTRAATAVIQSGQPTASPMQMVEMHITAAKAESTIRAEIQAEPTQPQRMRDVAATMLTASRISSAVFLE